MPNIKVNISKYHIFIHKPSGRYAIIEKQLDSVFMKLLVIYDCQFDKISDNQLIQVQFLDLDRTANTYRLMEHGFKTIKVNELSNLSMRTKWSLKLKAIWTN